MPSVRKTLSEIKKGLILHKNEIPKINREYYELGDFVTLNTGVVVCIQDICRDGKYFYGSDNNGTDFFFDREQITAKCP